MRLLQTTNIGVQNGEKMWERHIVEITSLCFVHERSKRVEDVKDQARRLFFFLQARIQDFLMGGG